jgi:23S rRNA (uracil1939-C5)-methyltransferase
LQVNRTLDVHIDKFAHRGQSLTRIDGLVVFVRGAVPGDRMTIRITNSHKSYAEAEPVDLLEPSSLRTAPRCIHTDRCGGCDWQHVSYPAQLEMKEQTVREALQFTGRFDMDQIGVNEPLAAEHPFYYRNKMVYTFSTLEGLPEDRSSHKNESTHTTFLGLHPRGEHNAVLDLRECYLQSPLTPRMIDSLRDFCREQGWSAWNPATESGYLRQFIVRMPTNSSDIMAYLTTTRTRPERLAKLASFFRDYFPAVTTFVHSVVDPVQTTIKNTRTLFGDGFVREYLNGHTFEIGPRSFFQPNTRQAEHLYERVVQMAELEASQRVYDLYCGIGALSFSLAPHVHQVVGIDAARPAIRRAEQNAQINDISNCRFIAGKTKQQLSHAVASHGPPDLIVCDPPRAGLDPSVVTQIRQIKPSRVVYVSCDPQTQARDLQRLCKDYTLEAVQPVDMFPQTYHVENVAKLSIKP